MSDLKAISEPDSSKAPENILVTDFSAAWERSEELQNILNRLPGTLVLKSGLSGQRGRLLERWENLETPGLDGALPTESMLAALRKWVDNAETLICYITRLGPQGKSKPENRSYSAPITPDEDYLQVIDSLEESDFVSNDWHWPWDKKKTQAIAKKEKQKMSKGNLIKYGVVGAVGLMAIISLLETEE